MTDSPRDVTALLQAWNSGNAEAREEVMRLVYLELRRRAAAHLRRERQGHSLQPTDLVHEAYLRMIDQRRAGWQNRAQFLAVASQMMRRILVDRARARRMAKRSGRWKPVTIDETLAASAPAPIDVLDLDAALTALASFDARKSRIVELRFFGGLSIEETAEAIGVSPATVKRHWAIARAWLARELESP